MKVLLLAAGQSKRVQPIEDKNFIRLCGKYLIEHQIESLYEAGFKDFLIIGSKFNLSRLDEVCRMLIASKKDLSASTVEQKDLAAGMAGAVLATEKLVELYEPVMIVSSNDVVESEAYKQILKASTNEKFAGVLLGKKVTEYFPGGYLKIDAHQTGPELIIEGIMEKPGQGHEPSDMINLVIHFHRNSHQLFSYLKKAKTDRDDRYEVALDMMIRDGKLLQALPYNGFWQAIKYPWHIFNVWPYFFQKTKKRVSKKAQISDRATIKGDVIIEDGVKIMENAVINGPCYLGQNVIVANNALVRGSNIESDSVVGFSTEIARSLIGSNVWTHSNYIGDSLIGDNCSFGAGTVTGNLRLDEKSIPVMINNEKVDYGSTKLGLITGNNIRVGINTSFMPGLKIGSNSFVGAGLVVAQDIAKNSFVRGETTLKISENNAGLNQAAREKMRQTL